MRGADRGSVSVELALVLPAAVLVLAMCLSAVRASAVGSTAPAAALAAARAATIAGDDAAVAAATRVAGGAARVHVGHGAGWIDVTVEVDLGWPWGSREARVSLPEQP